MKNTYLISLLFSILVVFSSGCRNVQEQFKEASIPSYKPTNFYAPGVPDSVQRVVVLPLYYAPYEDEYLTVLEGSFQNELSKRTLFEIVMIDREDLDMLFHIRQASSSQELPYQFLERLNERYHIDAVLFTDLTYFEPYKPLGIGVRSKLVGTDGSVYWAFDDIFDAGSLPVAVGAKRFTLGNSHTPFPLDTGNAGLQGPELFTKYVAFEMYGTLDREKSQSVDIEQDV